MKTIEEIGRETKAKHADKYDHLSDAEVGRKMKAKYPERYPDETLEAVSYTSTLEPLVPQIRDLVGDYTLPEQQVKYYTQQDIQIIVDHYHPNLGRLSSWWRRGQAESRNLLLSVLNEEQLQVIRQGAILEEAIIAKKKSMAEYQIWVTQNAATLQHILVNEQLINNALRVGLTVENHQHILVAGQLSEVKITEAKGMSEVAITEHEKRTNIDLDARWKEILQDSKAADLAMIGDHLVIKKLREELTKARRERYALKTGDDPKPLKRELLADYNKFITRLEAKIDARETGYLFSENRPQARELEESTSNSRSEYPPETDEDTDSV